MNRAESSDDKKKRLNKESQQRSRKRQKETETEEQALERRLANARLSQLETEAQSEARRAANAEQNRQQYRQAIQASQVAHHEQASERIASNFQARDQSRQLQVRAQFDATRAANAERNLRNYQARSREAHQQQIAINHFNEALIDEHDCGTLDVICQFCRSVNFLAERPSDGKFNSCCRKGKVMLPKVLDVNGVVVNYPDFLLNLLSNPIVPSYLHFRRNIRAYNSAVSFASMGAKIVELPGRGPYVFKVFLFIFLQNSLTYLGYYLL